MAKSKKNKHEKMSGDIYTVMLQYFKDHHARSFNEQQIIKKFAGRFQKFEIVHLLQRMVDKGSLRLFGDAYSFQSTATARIVAGKDFDGTIEITRNGSGYVLVGESGRDIYVAPQNLKDALDGDSVTVRKINIGRKGGRPEGVVISILKRKREQFIGVLERAGQHYLVVPDNKRIHIHFNIAPEQLKDAKDGDKVLVKLEDWPPRESHPKGSIIEVLKGKDPSDLEMQAILLDNGFFTHFPDEVIREAEDIPVKISPEEIAVRRDFRKVTTFTIDPDDAKDFDDAISIKKLDNNLWEIGVHIADVSHYVPENSLLEKEAIRRATSVYLVDRVAPMFPEYLSNILCSLRPQEEKLCFSVVFTMDENAQVTDRWFGRTVIFSDKRFTYDEAQTVLDGGEGPHKEELLLLNKLAGLLRKKRFREGSLNFDMQETRFKLDEQGKPIGVLVKERKPVHMLIEDFMLLANKHVARFCGKEKNPGGKIPVVYRVHDLPDVEKLIDFSMFAARFGYKLKLDTPMQIADSLNKMVVEIKGKPEQNILESLAIRSMAKATYTTKNIGHFGLGFDHYCHFTSPIRRYPDVMTHRILSAILDNKTSSLPPREVIESRCKHSSEKERSAQEAERASVKYKMAEYMLDKLGQTFTGVISGVKSWGMFVYVPDYNCEGLIPMDSLNDDVYVLDERNMLIKGMHKHRTYKFGDNVTVNLEFVNMEKRTIDFRLINE
jgi:ribonuclease R